MFCSVSRMLYCTGSGIRKPAFIRVESEGSSRTFMAAAISETTSVSSADQLRDEEG